MHKVIIKQDLLTHRLVFKLVTLPLTHFFEVVKFQVQFQIRTLRNQNWKVSYLSEELAALYVKVFLDLKQHINYGLEEIDCFEPNFDISLQLCVFLWHTKADFHPFDRKSKWHNILEVTKLFVNFKTKSNYQYFSFCFN